MARLVSVCFRLLTAVQASCPFLVRSARPLLCATVLHARANVPYLVLAACGASCTTCSATSGECSACASGYIPAAGAGTACTACVAGTFATAGALTCGGKCNSCGS